MLKPALLLLATTLTTIGCTTRAETRMAHPSHTAHTPANRVTVPNTSGDEVLLGLPRGALSSTAELREVRAGAACFDVAIRTWRGADARWTARLRDASGRALSKARTFVPDACTLHSARPSLTGQGYPMDLAGSSPDITERCERLGLRSDMLEDVKVGAASLCFASSRPIQDTRGLILEVSQGAYTIEMAWGFQAP